MEAVFVPHALKPRFRWEIDEDELLDVRKVVPSAGLNLEYGNRFSTLEFRLVYRLLNPLGFVAFKRGPALKEATDAQACGPAIGTRELHQSASKRRGSMVLGGD